MKFTLLLFFLFIFKLSCATFGEFASAVVVTTTSSNNYNLTGSGANCINTNCSFVFNGANFGSFVKNSGGLKLSGGEIKSWKDSWSNVCGGRIYYTVYLDGFRPSSPVFSDFVLPFKANCGGSTFNDGIGPCGGNDQKWSVFSSGVDLTTYNAGNYAIEIYIEYYGNDASASGCGTTKYISNSGGNYIAKFTITNPVALPIELLDFKASCNLNGALISWITASEISSESFVVEKSMDGKNWIDVKTIKAAINSNQLLYYSIADNQSMIEDTYYRLRQNDLNGNFEYFDPVFLNCSERNEVELYCFSGNENQIDCIAAAKFNQQKFLKLQTFDLLGKMIAENEVEVKNESISISFDQTFTSGIYLIHLVDLQTNETLQTLKYFVK